MAQLVADATQRVADVCGIRHTLCGIRHTSPVATGRRSDALPDAHQQCQSTGGKGNFFLSRFKKHILNENSQRRLW